MEKIAVLYGGWSAEREISVLSCKNVANGLKKLQYDVTEIDVKKDLKYITEELYKANPDFIFNILHGNGGEDGVIQGVLDIFGVPYSNSGVLASAICFDKTICKELAKSAGVRVADGFETDPEHILEIKNKMAYPFVIKPTANGSSVGLFTIFGEEEWQKFINTPWTFGKKIMVEKYIPGREFTVCVLNGKAIGAIEITFEHKTYDYEAKYEPGASSHISNYEMEAKSRDEMFKMAEDVFKVCNCSGIARMDFRYDGKQVYFLEANTQPGMTELSLAPDIAKFAGLSFEELLQKIIDSSLNSL